MMGFTWAAGVEEQRLVLISITWEGAIGNSRKLLFLGAVGCICCIGRLVTFWEVVFCHKKKNTVITTGNSGEETGHIRLILTEWLLFWEAVTVPLVNSFLLHRCLLLYVAAYPTAKPWGWERHHAGRRTVSSLRTPQQMSAAGALQDWDIFNRTNRATRTLLHEQSAGLWRPGADHGQCCWPPRSTGP